MKTIKLQNIRIKETIIIKTGDKYSLTIDYAILDDKGVEWKTKRIVEEDLTPGQTNKLNNVFTAIINKILTLEELQ